MIWKRGPQSDMSRNYKFPSSENKVILDDQFERVSGFYQNKEGIFQKKTCEFKVMVDTKV